MAFLLVSRKPSNFMDRRNKMSKTLKKLSGFEGVQGPVLTIVMDGVGLAPDTVSNALAGA